MGRQGQGQEVLGLPGVEVGKVVWEHIWAWLLASEPCVTRLPAGPGPACVSASSLTKFGAHSGHPHVQECG